MTETWTLAAIWLGLALIAALFSVWLRIATALSEIVVGTLAQFISVSPSERPCSRPICPG
jgi:glutathione-regulated potassium-efflux system ancillary protein KefC